MTEPEQKLNVEFWVVAQDGTYRYQCWKGVRAVRVTRGPVGEWPETLGVFGGG